MKKSYCKQTLMFFLLGVIILLANAEPLPLQNSPLGFWQTIDDITGKPKAIVEIKELPNKTLSAYILKIYPRPGHDQNEICTACEGEKHNQRIVGMRIMDNLKQSKKNQTMWVNGKILDPNNGKIYHCNIQLLDKNQKLQVRGYIGLPLFGRSQIWKRVVSPNGVTA